MRWSDRNPATGEIIPEMGLRNMCEYGAKNVAEGRYDVLKFEVMPDEVEFVKNYMRERYPHIPIIMNYPVFRTAPSGAKPEEVG